MPQRRRRPLPPRHVFHRHLRHAALRAFALVGASLALGVAGYHFTEGLPWIDALMSAAMILTGMGPTSVVHTTAGKLFATGYALFSGVVFLTLAAVLFQPVLHRFLHRFHLELELED